MLKEVASWKPESESDRRLVQKELSAILSSSHFGNSKRYPSFLRHIVEKALDGQADQLKERTLGVEVFDRRPDYDTNADPVVRFSASEVRKRIAQYYHERGEDSEIQIELPLGSYAPTFRMRFDSYSTGVSSATVQDRAIAVMAEPPSTVVDGAQPLGLMEVTSIDKWHPRLLPVLGLTLLAICTVVAVYVGYAVLHPKPIDQLWSPILQNPSPVLIVVGSGNMELGGPESPSTNLYDHMVGPYHHVSISIAVAISRLTNVLQAHGKAYSVKEAGETSLTDMRARPVVLVGALNNAWTLRLIEPLRFRFVHGPQARIEDTKDPKNLSWSVDFNKPFTSVSSDYAIIARYHDSSTNGGVIIVAGLGPYGTEAASDFLSSPQYLEQLTKKLPHGVKDVNLEMVIKTDVIAGEAGPPYLVAATTF